MFSENNPIPEAAEGVTKGIISWGEEKVRELVKNFNDRKLVFINNQETIDLVKEQLDSGDWSLCRQYLKDKELKILVQIGLTFRKLESKPNQLLDLRSKIVKKFQTKGLHIAQVVQNGILTEFIGSIASKVNSGLEIVEKVENLLLNVDKFVIFVKASDSMERKKEEIIIRLQANNPDAMIIFSFKSAIDVAKGIKELLEKDLIDYTIESKEEKNRYLLLIFRDLENLFDYPQKA